MFTHRQQTQSVICHAMQKYNTLATYVMYGAGIQHEVCQLSNDGGLAKFTIDWS